MSKIAARAIPSFFEVECDIVAHSTIDDQKAILELLKDESKGSVEDRARLLLLITIALSASDTMNETNYKPENEQFVDSNGNANLITNIYDDAFVTGCKNMLSPVVAANSGSNAITLSNATVEKCLKSVRFLRKQLKLSPLNTNNMNAKDSNDAFSSLLSSASSHATSLLAKATTFFSKFSPMYVTKVVESLAEGRKSEENMNYSYYDAKASLMANESKSIENMRYSDVIVFMIGGGCYNEYNNLQELIKTKCSASGGGSNNTPILPNSKHITGQHIYFPRNVTYGCTELVCGATFMSQLEKLD